MTFPKTDTTTTSTTNTAPTVTKPTQPQSTAMAPKMTTDGHGEQATTRHYMELIAHYNNLGITSMLDSAKHADAVQQLRQALDKCNEASFFTLPTAHLPLPSKAGRASKSLYIYQRGEYSEGFHTYSEPVALDATTATSSGGTPLSVATATSTVMFNLGQLSLRMNQHKEASAMFFRALQIAQQVDEKSTGRQQQQQGVTAMAILHQIGHAQYRSGSYEDAVRTYGKALQMGKVTFNSTLR